MRGEEFRPVRKVRGEEVRPLSSGKGWGKGAEDRRPSNETRVRTQRLNPGSSVVTTRPPFLRHLAHPSAIWVLDPSPLSPSKERKNKERRKEKRKETKRRGGGGNEKERNKKTYDKISAATGYSERAHATNPCQFTGAKGPTTLREPQGRI